MKITSRIKNKREKDQNLKSEIQEQKEWKPNKIQQNDTQINPDTTRKIKAVMRSKNT